MAEFVTSTRQAFQALANAVKSKVTENNPDMLAEYRGTAGVAVPPPTSFANTFAEVSMGTPNGSSTAQALQQGLWSTLEMNIEDSDVGNNYNATTFIYTTPSAGIYMMNGKVRLISADVYGSRLGLGFHTSNNDGAWVQWVNPVAIPIAKTYNYTRMATFPAGAQLRFYVFADGAANMPIGSNTANPDPTRRVNQAGMSVIRIA